MDGCARAAAEFWDEQELLEGAHDAGHVGVAGLRNLLVRPSLALVRFDAALDRVLAARWVEVVVDGGVVLTGDGLAHLREPQPVQQSLRWYRLQAFRARWRDVPGR